MLVRTMLLDQMTLMNLHISVLVALHYQIQSAGTVFDEKPIGYSFSSTGDVIVTRYMTLTNLHISSYKAWSSNFDNTYTHSRRVNKHSSKMLVAQSLHVHRTLTNLSICYCH